MAFTKKNDEAVSPVIGVILMVAVTVILAAVIAAFVFGMAGNMSKGKVVGLTATKGATGTITVTNMGGQDVAGLETLSATVAGGDAQAVDCKTIGSYADLTGGTAGTGQRVLITGTFTDGTTQILLDSTI